MTLKSKFILWLSIVHSVFTLLIFMAIKISSIWFVVAEASLLLSIFISYKFYNSFNQYFAFTSMAIAALKAQDFNVKISEVGHKEIDDFIAVYNGISHRLRKERIRQTEQNSFLEKLIQFSPWGIIVLDETGYITAINPAACNMLKTKHTQLFKTNIKDLPGKLAEVFFNLKAGESEIVTLSGVEVYKCQKVIFSDLGYKHSFIMIETLTDDIYKREKAAYEKVIKMLSHETNNSIAAINSILTTIIGYKEQLNNEDREDYKEALVVAIERNKALVNTMHNFAKVVKIPAPFKEKADLNTILKSVYILMKAQAEKKNIVWQLNLNSAPFWIELDVQQFEQVFINIFKNSIEALSPKGQILIATSEHPRCLIISDNGSGISSDASNKLFTPFFSTKQNGQGIGLTITREILKNHNFSFSLATNDGWTHFAIYF